MPGPWFFIAHLGSFAHGSSGYVVHTRTFVNKTTDLADFFFLQEYSLADVLYVKSSRDSITHEIYRKTSCPAKCKPWIPSILWVILS